MSWTTHYLADHPHVGLQLAAWLHEAWPGTYTSERALATIERFANRDRLPLAFFACGADLSPVGMVSLVDGTTPLRASAAFLLALYVVPAHRRQGIGAELCRRASAEARRLGWPVVSAYATDQKPFYEQIGWRTAMRAVVTSEPRGRLVWYMENALIPTGTIDNPV